MTVKCLQSTTGGQTWAYDGTARAVAINTTPAKFVQDNLDKQYDTYRLVGSSINAELITRLFQQNKHVQVCSPLVGGTHKERQNIPQLLCNVYDCALPAQLGGPHTLTEDELPTYAIADQVYLNNNNYPEHPLWAKMKWIRGLNKQAFHRLLGIITDPRWYVDLNNPNRLSKLYAYLKLDPAQMQFILNNTHGLLGTYSKGKYVIDCWYSEALSNLITYNYSTFDAVINQDIGIFGLAPEDWLWRMWWTLTDNGKCTQQDKVLVAKDDSFVKAMVKVSKRFIRFLYHIWMESLYPNNVEWQFRPEDFLRYASEIDSFNHYRY